MNWLRNKLRAWLGIEEPPDWGVAIDMLGAHVTAVEEDNKQLRSIVADLVIHSQREVVGISLRVEDFESSQLKALDEFRDPKKEN